MLLQKLIAAKKDEVFLYFAKKSRVFFGGGAKKMSQIFLIFLLNDNLKIGLSLFDRRANFAAFFPHRPILSWSRHSVIDFLINSF